jgi:hypothetical protein
MAPLTTPGRTINVILNDVYRISIGAETQLDIGGLMETGDLLQGSSANAI